MGTWKYIWCAEEWVRTVLSARCMPSRRWLPIEPPMNLMPLESKTEDSRTKLGVRGFSNYLHYQIEHSSRYIFTKSDENFVNPLPPCSPRTAGYTSRSRIVYQIYFQVACSLDFHSWYFLSLHLTKTRIFRRLSLNPVIAPIPWFA